MPGAVWVLIGGSILALIGNWCLAIWGFPTNDPAAVLHYSIDIGIDFVGEGKQIMVLPGIGTILLVFNTILGMILYRADQRAAWTVWATIPIIQAILLCALFLLWRANM